jgi:hypothetical protein
MELQESLIPLEDEALLLLAIIKHKLLDRQVNHSPHHSGWGRQGTEQAG